MDNQNKDFFEKLSEEAQNSGDALILAIVQNAKKGDASSLKILEKALNESRFSKEGKLTVTDEQYRRIILLAADRLRGVKISPTA